MSKQYKRSQLSLSFLTLDYSDDRRYEDQFFKTKMCMFWEKVRFLLGEKFCLSRPPSAVSFRLILANHRHKVKSWKDYLKSWKNMPHACVSQSNVARISWASKTWSPFDASTSIVDTTGFLPRETTFIFSHDALCFLSNWLNVVRCIWFPILQHWHHDWLLLFRKTCTSPSKSHESTLSGRLHSGNRLQVRSRWQGCGLVLVGSNAGTFTYRMQRWVLLVRNDMTWQKDWIVLRFFRARMNRFHRWSVVTGKFVSL